MEIHYVDWIVWLVLSIIYFKTGYPENDTGLEGCAVVLMWAVLSIIYAVIFYHFNWIDIIVDFYKSLDINP